MYKGASCDMDIFKEWDQTDGEKSYTGSSPGRRVKRHLRGEPDKYIIWTCLTNDTSLFPKSIVKQ